VKDTAPALSLDDWLARFADVRLDPANVIRGTVRVPRHEGMVPTVVGPRMPRVAPVIRRAG
jgi:hypothetical protein